MAKPDEITFRVGLDWRTRANITIAGAAFGIGFAVGAGLIVLLAHALTGAR